MHFLEKDAETDSLQVLTINDLARNVLGERYLTPTAQNRAAYEEQFQRITKAGPLFPENLQNIGWILIDGAQDLTPGDLGAVFSLQSSSRAYRTVAFDHTQQWRPGAVTLQEFQKREDKPWEAFDSTGGNRYRSARQRTRCTHAHRLYPGYPECA